MSQPPRTPIKPKRLRKLLKRLLDIYSPSGKEEQIVDFMARYLKRHGLPLVRQPVDENRQNLVVPLSDQEAALGFIGHLDTVTAYDLDDFGCQETGDIIKGLGAADMKAACAAMVEAFTCLWEDGRRHCPIALALVVGEEEEGDGAGALAREFHFPWAIIGEPTDLKPCLRHYGYLEIQLTTRGRRLHASLARRGRNAVEEMLRILLRLSKYLEKGNGELVYNIRDLFSSGGGFVVPDGCEARVDVHLPPTAPVGEITVEIEDLIAAERQANPALDAVIHFPTVQAGYMLPEKGEVVEALKATFLDRSLEWEALAFPSHSDANQLWSSGIKPIVLGCGQLEKAHSPEESVCFAQVIEAAEIYYQLAVRILSGREGRAAGENRTPAMPV